MPSFSASTAVLTIAIVLLLARPAHAFGAGNIQAVSKIEGSNCEQNQIEPSTVVVIMLTVSIKGRHGDIEDTLLTLVMSRAAGGKKWDKMNVARTYFGNWLRDYCAYIPIIFWIQHCIILEIRRCSHFQRGHAVPLWKVNMSSDF